MPHAFNGFPPEALMFLHDLAAHNERAWFEANRSRYEQFVREPALAFIVAMQGPLAKVSPHVLAEPKKMGGSLMRIHRDTRFARDKSPYKTNIGIQFRHEAGRDAHAPGVYLHIAPEEVFLAVGIWQPPSEGLAAIRNAIVEHPAEWKRARDARPFRARFELQGERLTRPPKGFEPEHPLIEDLKWKSFIGVQPLSHELLFDRGLVKETAAGFKAAAPLMKFICKALHLAF